MKPDNQNITNFPKLGAPAESSLVQAGYVQLEQLTKVTEVELGRLHGMGPSAIGRLREGLTLKGLSFTKAGEGGR